MSKYLGLLVAFSLISSVTPLSFAQTSHEPRFQVTSSTFTNDGKLPLIAIHNVLVNGKNVCTSTGAAGGNESPELSWTNAPADTKTFVVVTYDVTAAFTHWGMYNISGNLTGLPQNAGMAGSSFGSQVLNDFGAAEYDGPCPPPNLEPVVHHYVFTVYALDVELTLPSSANFPANAETLYQALIEAGKGHRILASASITGLHSSAP